MKTANKTLSTPKLVAVISVAAVLFLCCGGVAVTAVLGDNKKQDPTPAGAAPRAVATQAALETPIARGLPSPSPSPSPVPLVMPNVAGANAAVADDQLKKLGFTNVQFGSADPGDTFVLMRANWKVIDQSAAAGTTIPSDTLIVLTCTKKR